MREVIMDFTTYDDEALDQLRIDVLNEQDRRYRIASAPAAIDALNRDYLAAEQAKRGQAWVQPLGTHDAYPEGWQVTKDGNTWESLTPANVGPPGASGWREVVGKEDTPAAWVQPTGAHDAYVKGAKVTFEDSVYESLIDANTYSPTAYPAGWKKL